ncbi:uncharacterized protein LOC134910766 [Pseudophryne corroboree]|uniref:uncharacterized protein LOC134910766 n=1 Tax=Pseudophryne corroboree TaxID=495146 RepID=UPI003081A72C
MMPTYARNELYDLMDRLQDHCLYHDTDSVIFVSMPGDWNPPFGDYLGVLTRELLPGTHITKFVSSGPQSYGYRLNNGKTSLKVKGITLNVDKAQHVNFDSLEDLILDYPLKPEGEDQKKIVTCQPCIVWFKKYWQIERHTLQKMQKCVYTKWKLTDNFTTLLFGINLTVVDVLMELAINNSEIEEVFTKYVQHRNLGIMYLVQNVFCQVIHHRPINCEHVSLVTPLLDTFKDANIDKTKPKKPVPLYYKYLLTFIFVIEEINKDQTILPNVTLGYHVYDSCTQSKKAVKSVLQILSGSGKTIPNYSCMGHRMLSGFIGGQGSLTTLPMAQILALYGYTQISYGATSYLLSDRNLYPTFYRTVQGDQASYSVLSSLIKFFGWTWVGVLASDDDSGNEEIELLTEYLTSRSICVAYTIRIKYYKLDVLYDMNKKRADIIRKSSAQVIILCGTYSSFLADFLKDMRKVINDKTLVFGPTFALITFLLEHYNDVFNGSLAIEPSSLPMLDMRSFYDSFQTINHPEDKLLEHIWLIWENCLSSDRKSNKLYSELYKKSLHNCPGKRNITEFASFHSPGLTDRVYKAVYSMAHALHNMHMYLGERSPKNIPPSYGYRHQLHRYLQNERRVDGEPVFNNNGDFATPYKIVNWQVSKQDRLVVHVGRTMKEDGNYQNFSIQLENIVWKNNINEVNGISLDHLIVIGSDGTNVYTEHFGGVIAITDCRLGKNLQRQICLLHINKLPLRHLFRFLCSWMTSNTSGHWQLKDSFKVELPMMKRRFDSFQIPELNFKANDYVDVFDWSKISLTSPLILKKLSDEKLKVPSTEPTRFQSSDLWMFPSHTQAVERSVKLIPKSQCSENCKPGTMKVLMSDLYSCCYYCVQCSAGKISNVTDSENCLKCADHEWPNEKKTQCVPKVLEFLSYTNDTIVVLILITTFVLFSLTFLILKIFILYRDTPLVKANNNNLSFLLLVSIMLSILSVFLFLGRPVDATCMLRQISFGILFSGAISCVLGKTIMVYIVFKANKPGSSWKSWINTKLSNCVVMLCSSIQVVICMSWVTISSPFQELDTHSYKGKIIVQCNEGSLIGFYSVLGYMGILAAISFITAFLARTLPDSFNEAKYITFSMLVFCSVWITMIPAYLSSKGKYMVAVEIFAILASCAGLLCCIFFPKCYIILWRPELNTRKHLLEKGNDRVNHK